MKPLSVFLKDYNEEKISYLNDLNESENEEPYELAIAIHFFRILFEISKELPMYK